MNDFQVLHYSGTSDECPSKKRTASLERTVHNVPKPSFYTLVDFLDNLPVVDNMAGPNVSFI